MTSPKARLDFEIDTSTWERFAPSAGSKVPSKLRFRATPTAFCRVLENSTVDDTVAILGTGAREPVVFWKPAQSVRLAAELLERAIDPRDFLEVYRTGGGWEVFGTVEGIESEEGQRVLDAAEYRSLPSARRLRDNWKDGEERWFAEEVRRGDIRLADIKAVGDKEVHGADRVFGDILRALARGESRATAAEIGAEVEGLTRFDRSFREMHVVGARLLCRYGAEGAGSVPLEATTSLMWDHVVTLDDPERERSLLRFCADVCDSGDAFRLITGQYQFEETDKAAKVAHDLFRLWEAGVDPDLARWGREEDLSADHIIAVHEQRVPRSLAGGWL